MFGVLSQGDQTGVGRPSEKHFPGLLSLPWPPPISWKFNFYPDCKHCFRKAM